jgi:thiol:disulfide interchange protein DsbA
MKPQRRRMIQLIATLPALGAIALARAQPKGGGEPYHTVNPPQPVEAPAGKIEVIEFFWYGCPHCYALEPSVESWSKKLPADVVFRRVPAPLAQSWVPHAQAFYAFETLGVLPKVHRAFFDAIHKDRLRIDSRPALEEWLKKQGVEIAKFEEAARSFSVQSNVRKAARMVANYQIEGVPTFAVQGRYTVGASDVPLERLMGMVDQLVGMSRKSTSK